jgi:hypothetical protein
MTLNYDLWLWRQIAEKLFWRLWTNKQPEFEKKAFSCDQVYQVVWSWTLHPAYKVLKLSDATTLTFKINRLHPFTIVIKMYDPETVFCLQCFPTKWCHGLKFRKQQASSSLIMEIKCIKQYNGLVSILLIMFLYWCYDFDFWSWKTKGVFLSLRCSCVPSCMILKLTVQSPSFLQSLNGQTNDAYHNMSHLLRVYENW